MNAADTRSDRSLGPAEPAPPRATAVKLSIVRTPPLPRRPPEGVAARSLPQDQFPGHPEYGLSPQRIVQIFRAAEAGWIQEQVDLFEGVVETDCHLRNLFDQRIRAVAGKPWVLAAAGASDEDALAARILQTALRRLPMTQLWKHQLSFNRHGFAASEIEWDIVEIEGRDWIVPVWFRNVPHRRFVVDKHDQLRLITADHPTTGEELAVGQWLITRVGGPKLARDGLMRTAMWPAKFKRDTFGDWYIYAQKYGLPLTLVKYELEHDEVSKDVGKEIIQNLSSDGGAMIPKGFEVEIKNEGRTSDSSGTHGGLISESNREMSKLINGGTLSNDNGDQGGSSYALGDVHGDVRFENLEDDAGTFSEALRLQVAEGFVRYNGLNAEAPYLVFLLARDTAPKQFLENADTAVNKLGVRVSRAQVRQVTGLREPLDDDDAVEKAPEPAPAPATAPGAAV